MIRSIGPSRSVLRVTWEVRAGKPSLPRGLCWAICMASSMEFSPLLPEVCIINLICVGIKRIHLSHFLVTETRKRKSEFRLLVIRGVSPFQQRRQESWSHHGHQETESAGENQGARHTELGQENCCSLCWYSSSHQSSFSESAAIKCSTHKIGKL